MTMFLINVLMAILWMFLWGSFDIYTLLAGMLLGYFTLGLFSRTISDDRYGGRVWRLMRFFVYFVRILVKANWDVAKVVLKPGFNEQCRIIRYPIAGLTDLEITSLANAITLTPGTLSIDVSNDKDWLYIHCMIGHDKQAVIKDIDDLRNHVLEDFI